MKPYGRKDFAAAMLRIAGSAKNLNPISWPRMDAVLRDPKELQRYGFLPPGDDALELVGRVFRSGMEFNEAATALMFRVVDNAGQSKTERKVAAATMAEIMRFGK